MRPIMTVAFAALLLAGCREGGRETGVSPPAPSPATLSEGWCNREGLKPALRQTILLVDERALVPGKGAVFRTQNGKLFEVVNTLASPTQGLTSGVMAPRERLTVYVLPSDGASPRMVYSGCAPGYSATEMAAAQADRSVVGDFVGGTLSGELEDEIEAYNRTFILSFVS